MVSTLKNIAEKLKVIYILGGDIKQAEDFGHLNGLGFRSSHRVEKDHSGSYPSYERIEAGAKIYSLNPQIKIVVSGGKSNLNSENTWPTISTIMKAELESLGVPSQNIKEENESYDTLEQLINCSRIACTANHKSSRLGLIAPCYQFPRILAILHNMRYNFPDTQRLAKARFLSIERILCENSETWQKYFKELYGSPEMQKSFVGELLGTGQILTGHSPFFPNPYKGLPDPLEPPYDGLIETFFPD